MQRTLLWVGPLLVGLAVTAILLFSLGSPVTPILAQPQPNSERPLAGKVKQPGVQLPISQVILFSSGVGYFAREGEVSDNVRVDLSFPVDDINDLLKSMVVQDLGGGVVSTVSYDSQDPIDKTLASFAIDLNGNPSFAKILNQARGEKIEVVMQQSTTTQPGTLSGSILGVESQEQQVKDAKLQTEILNLWCSEGIRAIKLSEVSRLRFLNPTLENEMKRALETLAQSHDTQKKAVSIGFTGEGKRPVRVSYVIENPIWKTSYRLVLGKEGKPYLQGWAVVENTTDEDWSDVRMALISGRPISFQMDLYQPLYINRPVVDLELFASLRPVVYGGAVQGGMGAGSFGLGLRNAPEEAAKRQPGRAKDASGLDDDVDRLQAFGRPKVAVQEMKKLERAQQMAELSIEKLEKSVQSAAAGGELGDYFQYLIRHPVSLARQKSAMLPIINQTVEGERVSIYNERVQNKHPLHGLKFKNTSGMHLMQGPITVYEGSSYSGDARIADLQPKEERLLSYAIDLGSEVEPTAKRAPDRLLSVKINRGLVYRTNKIRQEKVYTIKNRSEHDRMLILEHPFQADFQLVEPKLVSERTREVYRFEIKVPKGETAKHTVIEERDLVQTVAMSNTNDTEIRFFLQSPEVSGKVKSAMKEATDKKNRIAEVQGEIQQVNRELKILLDDQTRLRANIAQLPQASDAYKRYLKKFDDQEPMIEKYQESLKTLQQREQELRQAFENYLATLTVE